jgi:hypothetical protein
MESTQRPSPEAAPARPVQTRWSVGVLVLLAFAGVVTLAAIGGFGRTRFFSVDEYQFGHATWLVSQGQVPYRDFFEHHFPASYVLHAALLPDDGLFSERALALREIAFGYLVGLALVLGAGTWWSTRNAAAALLSGFVPLAGGFGLMSAIDYRADNFAAALFLAALALAEANRRARRRSLALLSGALAGLAVAMTQKMLVVAGGTCATLLALELWSRTRGRRDRWLAFPTAFMVGAGIAPAVFVAAGAWLGLLPQAFELTVRQAIQHEADYPGVPVWRYLEPFLADTPWTTGALGLCFVVALARAPDARFWRVPVVVVLLSGAAVKAQYPYNYVFAWWVERLAARGAARAAWSPALYLLPLLLLPDQLGFLVPTTTNRHQLQTLDTIQRFSRSDDAVIDGAGGALFRPHASYYWYHGDFHRLLLADYFERELADDYRRSEALFWIDDLRQRQLPEPVRRFFAEHYVRVRGNLYALGFELDPGDMPEREIDLLRGGRWFAYSRSERGEERAALLEVDGGAVGRQGAELEPGRHRVRVVSADAPVLLSPLPRELFAERPGAGGPHAMMFEFERPRPPTRRAARAARPARPTR